jgi:hypothetical protein
MHISRYSPRSLRRLNASSLTRRFVETGLPFDRVHLQPDGVSRPRSRPCQGSREHQTERHRRHCPFRFRHRATPRLLLTPS